MKEYEYIILAIDGIFSHMITSVICLENYRRDNLDGVFRNIFPCPLLMNLPHL